MKLYHFQQGKALLAVMLVFVYRMASGETTATHIYEAIRVADVIVKGTVVRNDETLMLGGGPLTDGRSFITLDSAIKGSAIITTIPRVDLSPVIARVRLVPTVVVTWSRTLPFEAIPYEISDNAIWFLRVHTRLTNAYYLVNRRDISEEQIITDTYRNMKTSNMRLQEDSRSGSP